MLAAGVIPKPENSQALETREVVYLSEVVDGILAKVELCEFRAMLEALQGGNFIDT